MSPQTGRPLHTFHQLIVGAISLWAAACILPAAAGADPPDLTPLAFLPGDRVIGPAAGSQTSPAVARGGDQYLAVWQDDRGYSPDIYAARVSAGGVPIDAYPIAISQAAGAQTDPRVAWNGSNWLVTWQSQIPTQYYYSYGVLAVRVSAQGQILDPAPITVIAYENSSSLMHALASDGMNWAVVAEGTSAGEAAIRGARVGPDGTVLDPGGIIIVPETYYLRFGIDLGGMPGQYLLVWNEWRANFSDDILAYRLTPGLQRVEANPFVIGSHAQYDTNARVAANGSGFFVAWNVNDNYLSSEVYGARVSFGGQVLDPNGRAFSNAGIGYGRNPSVTWDGANWIASWPNYGSGGLNAGRMSPQGALLDPGGVGMPDLGWGSIAGSAGGGFVAAWSDATGGSADVYTGPVSGSLVPGPRTCSSLGAPRQTEPAFAFNGTDYLAVFLSARSDGSRILGQRLDTNGNAIDQEPFEIVGPVGNYGPPSVGWDGSRYMVTYTQQSRIYARRVALDGTILDPTPILVMNGQETSVAGLNGVFLVAGNNAPQNPEILLIFGTRVRGSDGVKLDGSPIAIGGSFSLHPEVASVGNRWLVVWEQHPTHDDPHAGVLGNFVHENGSTGTPVGMGGQAAYNLRPAVAAGTDTALVAWSDSRLGFNNLDIYARRVLANGAVLDGAGLALSTAANSQTRAAIGWDGREFVALFQDPRNIPTFFDEHLDVYGARVLTSGQVIDPGGFVFSNDPVASEVQPALAGGGGSAVLGCAAYRVAAPDVAFRIGTRLLRHLDPADAPAAAGLPDGPARMSASPNPFSDRIDLTIRCLARAEARLSIIDVSGREIASLHEGPLEKGETRVSWGGRDRSGRRVPAGVYFARLAQGDESQSVKLALQ